jgi:hypothetical protein
MLAHAAFDAELNHSLACERLGIPSTVIPLNRRISGRNWPQTRYRRQMVKRLRRKPRRSRGRRVHGQRSRIESGLLRNKRVLGSALRARRWPNQKREVLIPELTRNLVLLPAA